MEHGTDLPIFPISDVGSARCPKMILCTCAPLLPVFVGRRLLITPDSIW